jgi:hypothetical protein
VKLGTDLDRLKLVFSMALGKGYLGLDPGVQVFITVDTRTASLHALVSFLALLHSANMRLLKFLHDLLDGCLASFVFFKTLLDRGSFVGALVKFNFEGDGLGVGMF